MKTNSQRVIDWRKRTKQKMVHAMGGCCQICQYSKSYSALEFHHIDPNEKDFNFGKHRANPKGLLHLITELKKCVLLCSNCHREVHSGESVVPENFSTPDETILVSESEIKRRIKSQHAKQMQTKEVKKRKIDMSNQELYDLLHGEFGGNKSALARYLFVSEAAIRKKLKNMLPWSIG